MKHLYALTSTAFSLLLLWALITSGPVWTHVFAIIATACFAYAQFINQDGREEVQRAAYWLTYAGVLAVLAAISFLIAASLGGALS